jgi:hypothetical protein
MTTVHTYIITYIESRDCICLPPVELKAASADDAKRLGMKHLMNWAGFIGSGHMKHARVLCVKKIDREPLSAFTFRPGFPGPDNDLRIFLGDQEIGRLKMDESEEGSIYHTMRLIVSEDAPMILRPLNGSSFRDAPETFQDTSWRSCETPLMLKRNPHDDYRFNADR